MRESIRPPLPIRTERLLLRPLTGPDVPALHAYRSLPAVCRYLPFEPMTEAEVREKVRDRWTGTALGPEGSALRLGVTAGGILVGDVVLFVTSRTAATAELGWILSPDHEGRGYATEAVAALLPVAFDGLRAHRVLARMDPANTRSAAVAERVGMRREALHVEDELIRGAWLDTLWYAMLEREFRARVDASGR